MNVDELSDIISGRIKVDLSKPVFTAVRDDNAVREHNAAVLKNFEEYYYNNRFAFDRIDYNKEKAFAYWINAVHKNENAYKK